MGKKQMGSLEIEEGNSKKNKYDKQPLLNHHSTSNLFSLYRFYVLDDEEDDIVPHKNVNKKKKEGPPATDR